MKRMKYNTKAIEIPKALSIYLNELVDVLKKKKKNITSLSLGESFLDVPYFGFDDIDFTKGYHYSDSKGLPELRKKISHYYNKNYNSKIDHENIIVSAGSKIILYMCFLAIINPKDEILVHEPAWLSYKEQIKLAGGKVKYFPHYESLSKLEKYVEKKTKAMVISSPNNPAGRLYSRKELNLIYKICLKKNIYLIVDEAYSDFVLNKKFISCSNIDKSLKNLIIVNSLSKNLGMSGWRIGYLISNESFVDIVQTLNQHLLTCAPTVLQMYIIKNFEKILSFTKPQIKNLLQKRKRIEKMLKDLKLKYIKSSSTFYFFLYASEFQKDIFNFAINLLLDHNISIVPGQAYGENTNNFFRISIGTETEKNIHEALKIIKYNLLNKKYSNIETQKKLKNYSLKQFKY